MGVRAMLFLALLATPQQFVAEEPSPEPRLEWADLRGRKPPSARAWVSLSWIATETAGASYSIAF